ncbi:MAG: glutamate--tRNA ligase [Nanoarchaeota archaeon]
MAKFSNEIKAYALKNVLEFDKTDAGKILPKLFQHGLQKEEIKEIMPEIQKIVKEVNHISKEQREKLFLEYKKFMKEHEEKEKGLPELPSSHKKVVLRIAPFPSGALHIGNAKTFVLNALYAEKYKGELILVMDDTIGSAEKTVEEESYKLIKDALDWLKINYSKTLYKSDRLKTYYKYAEQLIKKDKAYVCHCSQPELKENREKGTECGCRQLPSNLQLKRWKEMFKLKEGKATLRIKTNMMHPNPAFRDRVLFKISDRKHPRVGNKYRVWPTLEMSWAIDDHVLGITHIIRGNDLTIESEMEKYIWDIFNWSHPVIIHTGLIRIEGIEGAKVSKSKSQQEIKSGQFTGWDDPRTWSIQSLARRGIKPEAIRDFIESIGLNKQDITVPIDALYSINRSIIDSKADRYSFIEDPIKLNITKKPDWKTIEIPKHPDKNEKRIIELNDIFISKKDYDALKGKEIRLLHLYNIELNKEGKVTSIDNKNIQKINWISNYVKAKILLSDGKWLEGIVDEGVKNLKKNELIQFERFGFVKFDSVKKLNNEDVYEFWFAHK